MTLVRTAVLAAGTVILLSAPAAAEFQFSAFMGWNRAFDSDISYANSGRGDDFTLKDVPWLGLSFVGDGGEPYDGARLTYWLENEPHWGVMLEYTHAKVRADPTATVGVSGTVGGAAAPTPANVNGMFDTLEFTDGINLVTINGVYRCDPIGPFVPYLGGGLGVSIPHTEVLRQGDVESNKTFKYEFGGLAAQIFAGAQIPVWRNISVFGEYKLSYAQVNSVPLVDGGTVSTEVLDNQILGGLAISFGGGH